MSYGYKPEGAQHRLKKCPFCGSQAQLSVWRLEDSWWCGEVLCSGVYRHECSAQMVCGGKSETEAVENVIAGWNRRNRNA